MLHNFEFSSGLSVNFHKSMIIGLNVRQHFLKATSNLLSCALSHFLFSFLGISIDCNPRIRYSWELVLSKLRNRLTTWRGKAFSLGGRVTLLKLVLNTIPMFLFSFYESPRVVINEIKKIQRAFL